MKGWIKLHRSLLDWEWYDDTSTVRLFLHLLLKANHKDKKYKGQIIKRGQLITGRSLLSEQTGLSEQQIRTCLNKLKSTSEITIKSTNKGTLVTLANYGLYQDAGAESTSESTSIQTNEQPASNQQSTTNKNVKNENKEDGDNPPLKKHKFTETDKKFATWMLSIISERLPNFKKPNLDKWADVIRLMREQDNREYSEMSDVFLWARDDNFWQGNILSAAKFREKYDMLLSQSISKPHAEGVC